MKIALISNMYPSKEFPVFGIFVKNTEMLLGKMGIETIYKAVIKGRKKGFQKLIAYIFLFFKIFLVFFNYNVKIVYIHFPLQTSFLINFLRIFSNKKIVLNIHGSELNKTSFFSKSFEKLLKNNELIIVPSAYYKSTIEKEFKIEASKIFVYPSGGIDKTIFNKKDTKLLQSKLNINANDFVCSYISTITKEKGWREFVNLAVLLEAQKFKIKYLVVGNGDEENDMKNQVKSYNLEHKFTFIDRQKQCDLAQYYSVSDIFVFPTHKESLGLVGIESLACGTPVIATDIGATRQYIKNGKNGYLFEKENDKDLAKKVILYYLSKEKERIEIETVKTAQKYDSIKCTKLLAEKLKNL